MGLIRFLRGAVFAFLMVLCGVAHADDISVSAGLDRSTAAVGDVLQFQVRLNGVQQSPQPPEIRVDGLDVQYRGMQTQFQSTNFSQMRVSVSHTYQVIPQREGTFTLPPVSFEIAGRRYQSEPVALKVEKGANPAPGGAAGGDQRTHFAEIVVGKKTAYVGEALPVELRLFVDSRVRWQLEAMPQLGGEGFTKTKMLEPKQETAQRDGREFDVVVFRTAVTPSKAGKLELGPADFSFIAQVPRARRNRGGSIFDMFDSMFDDPVFAQNQRVTTKAEAAELEVKPLPVQGRPKDFSGAVGSFKMTADGSPAEVKVGDPVTMKVQITGRGNFDRIVTPVMSEPKGWRSYPSTSAFAASDDIGMRGAKSFEIAAIPEVAHTAMPEFTFTYFDPDNAKYVTLKTPRIPLAVTGGASPAAEPAPPAAASATPQAKPQPTPPPAVTDIHGLRYDFGRQRSAFEPLYAKREFQLAQIVPGALLLGYLSWRILRRSEAQREKDTLRQESAALQRKLRGSLPDVEFFAAASRLIQVETALATGGPAGSVDAGVACRARRLNGEIAAGVEAIFAARAELLYAGSGGVRVVENRESVLRTIEQFLASDVAK